VTFVFRTKGKTLCDLGPVMTTANVLPLVLVEHGAWQTMSADHIERIVRDLGNGPFIVRSSSRTEDQPLSSLAGAFLSVRDVDVESLPIAISEVFASYESLMQNDEVLIQPMLKSVLRSGVVFTHDPSTGSPYRTVNWHEGDDTAAVTGGTEGKMWQQAASGPAQTPKWMVPVMAMLDELIVRTGHTSLDCEFAIVGDAPSSLYLLQVRPLVLQHEPESDADQYRRLQILHEFVANAMRPHPFLNGSRTVFGVMPDWNPAEIIGIRPRPLALSLYREMVTDSVWAYQRHNYGYRNLRSFPLMTQFMGQPYIDVRVSFNSFIPADLDDQIADRLVEHYLTRLVEDPILHDKVEFEIVLSCYSFDIDQRLGLLQDSGFTANECSTIAASLRRLTNRIIDPVNGQWRGDAARLPLLASRRARLASGHNHRLENFYWLIEDGKRYGTLPFAGLARAGFVAVQILRSLVATGIFSNEDLSSFMASISTVSSEMIHDRRVLPREDFLERYGHLRPGTYDIRSLRYDEAPDMYFDWDDARSVSRSVHHFALTLEQESGLASLLRSHSIDSTPEALVNFCRTAIELRERSKFEFTRNLSDALSLLVEFGGDLGFSRDDMSYSDVNSIFEIYRSAGDAMGTIGASIELGRRRYEETARLCLPPVIIDPLDVWGFEIPEAAPNYITQKTVVAPVVPSDQTDRLRGSIVAIPSADPGYDWLFSHGIAGLITEWGGANSHMAIRAGELGLPAVIGAGELLFRRWVGAERLRIDCATRQVEVIN